MNVLLIAATTREIAGFLARYRLRDDAAGNRPDTDILITGIGLTATTYQLARQCRIKRPGLVIQAGIAGCFDKNVPLGSVRVISRDRIADEGVLESGNWKTIEELKLGLPNRFPYKNGWLVNPSKTILRKTGLRAVSGISVNQVSTSLRGKFQKSFSPVTESMEGAALHYVCLQEGIPFIQLRAISNYAGERDKKKWKIKEAISNLNLELIQLLNNL